MSQQQCLELTASSLEYELVAGVDEAGRGPLAGPVVAAAVILDPNVIPVGIDDSKKLSAAKRSALAIAIKKAALHWHITAIDAAVIDQINILQATMKAMHDAVMAIPVAPQLILIDGNRAPEFSLSAQVHTLIGGDARDASIAAASILAKTHRDALMCEFDVMFPGYGFAAHTGYGTPAHLSALAALGPCDIHRKSFAPGRRAASQSAGDPHGGQ